MGAMNLAKTECPHERGIQGKRARAPGSMPTLVNLRQAGLLKNQALGMCSFR